MEILTRQKHALPQQSAAHGWLQPLASRQLCRESSHLGALVPVGVSVTALHAGKGRLPVLRDAQGGGRSAAFQGVGARKHPDPHTLWTHDIWASKDSCSLLLDKRIASGRP